MDIHKPKPWRGFREFLKEYLIIVVGVLTALGAEQVVETLHWRHEVAETRKTLAGEIDRNIERLERRQQLSACFAHRLDDLGRYLAARAAGDRSPPPGKVGLRNGVLRLNTNAWESAKSAQLMAHMPPDERERYSRLYNEFEYAAERLNQEQEALGVLGLADDAAMLESADWSQVRLARRRALFLSGGLSGVVGTIVADAKAVVGDDRPARGDKPPGAWAGGGGRAGPAQGDVLSVNRELCAPWYADPPAASRP